MSTKAVIFDLGNVLVKYDWKSYLATFEFDEKTFQVIANAMFLNDIWQQGDAGLDPETQLDLFIKEAPAYEKEIRAVHEKLSGCVSKYDYTDSLIQYFRDLDCKIYYLSNYSEDLFYKTKDKLSFINHFDGGVFSFEEKCIKPNEKIYQILLERYQIKPEEALFFDDREENINAAEKLGIPGEVFSSETVLKYLSEDI